MSDDAVSALCAAYQAFSRHHHNTRELIIHSRHTKPPPKQWFLSQAPLVIAMQWRASVLLCVAVM